MHLLSLSAEMLWRSRHCRQTTVHAATETTCLACALLTAVVPAHQYNLMLSYTVIVINAALFSPHSIAMPKALYFTTVFSSSLFRCLISKVTGRISTKLGHIFTYDCYLKNLVRTPQAFILHGLDKKTAFWDRLWTLTEHISAMEHDINNRKEICQSAWIPLHAPNLVNFGEKRLRTVGEFLPTPKFSHWKTLPALPHGRYITDSRQTLSQA